MKRLIALVLLSAAVLAGCATLDERQRGWIFQPSDRAWGNSAAEAEGMQDGTRLVDFYELGLGDVHGVSAAHGQGIRDLVELQHVALGT